MPFPLLNSALARLLPPDTPRAVAPPGNLNVRPAAEVSDAARPPILVVSLMRSGTHLLIDLILNNFPTYRQRYDCALYCDLDRYIEQGLPESDLDHCREQVIKTHIPQLPASGYEAAVGRLAGRSLVFALRRDYEAMMRSFHRFEDPRAAPPSPELIEDFESRWNTVDCQWIDFEDLLAPDKFVLVVNRVAAALGERPPNHYVLPPEKSQLWYALALKAGTRLLGARMKTVNTTIGFGLR